MRISALNRKLLRDVLAMKGQAIAIAFVIAAGVAMFVTYLANFDSLRRAQADYYERQRFADVFASLKRAPRRLEERIAAIPGVAHVETRVVASVILDVPGFASPAAGRLVSIPEGRRPLLNGLHLVRGRWPEPERPGEVVASQAFCDAHRFEPGAHVAAVINGRRRALTIVGIGLSPEYVYSIPPGELIPDDLRFGVFWMNHDALANAFNMEGGFNDLSLSLFAGSSDEEVIAAVDRLLEPYGGLGAIPRALQFSHWTLESELTQLQDFGFIVPAIFLLVAAFILNIALTRALALQRPQIAALKALGYANHELAWHYLKWALLIAAAGVAIGIAVGAWLGSGMSEIYSQYFRFPTRTFRLPGDVLLAAVAFSLGAATLGALSAVRRAVRIPPAEAMRPEPPARYRRSLFETPWLRPRLPHAARIVLRNLERQPLRALASTVGVAFAVAILLVGFAFIDMMGLLIEMQFNVAERQDVTITFVEPRGSEAWYAVAGLPGVLSYEPYRAVPVRMRSGHHHRTLAISGVPTDPRLRRVVDREGRAFTVPSEGLILSRKLAEVLGVAVGETVRVEVLEGSRPVRHVRVAGTVDDLMGLSAYMAIDRLRRLMREGGTLSGAALQVDSRRASALSARLKSLPAVAGVAFREAMLRSFRETFAQNMNLMIVLNVVFAGVIAFGVVYNAARVSLSERYRELASLRVLGFTRAEISLILLGELTLVTLASLPLGIALGYALAWLVVGTVQNEVYRFPLLVSARSIAWALFTVCVASALSALVVRRRLDRLDLVAVLKIRE